MLAETLRRTNLTGRRTIRLDVSRHKWLRCLSVTIGKLKPAFLLVAVVVKVFCNYSVVYVMCTYVFVFLVNGPMLTFCMCLYVDNKE